MGWGYFGDFNREYVSAAEKRANGVRLAAEIAGKQGRAVSPVRIQGRKIAHTFWGQAWCDNLAAYSDYSNRLPRGATYVRNGSVADLIIKPSRIEAVVAGSDAYLVTIVISSLKNSIWSVIKRDCTTEIDSLLDLLAGKFSDGVMKRLTRKGDGLFPAPQEIKMDCSCPDSSRCCKHLAAVMYAVGSRLDQHPELLFTLREVDPQELVSQAVTEGRLENELEAGSATLAGQDLEALFGIELESSMKTSAAEVNSKPARNSRSQSKPKSSKASNARSAASVRTATQPTKAVKSTKKKPRTRTTDVAALTIPVKNIATTARAKNVKDESIAEAKAPVAANRSKAKSPVKNSTAKPKARSKKPVVKKRTTRTS